MIYGKVKDVSFSITYVDEVGITSKDFDTIDKLVAFIKANPEINAVVELPA